MKLPFAVLPLFVAVATTAAAQTSTGPNLVLTISGGVLTGTSLWRLPAQLVPVVAAGSTWDTISLGRRVGSGIVAAVGGTYFPGPHLGYTGEIGYFGVDGTGECRGVGTFKGDSAHTERPNMLACDATNGGSFPTSLVGFQGGLTYRFFPAGTVQPYLRAIGGVGLLSNSFVATIPTIAAVQTCSATGGPTCQYTLLQAPSTPAVTWVMTLAAGNTFRLSPAYNARLELRDVITALPFARDSGNAADLTPVAKQGWRIRHMVALTFGLDVVLERSHRRRY